MAKKLTEAMLYQTWLDIKYSQELNRDVIHDMEIELKIHRKARTKIKKLLKKASQMYCDIYGSEPIKHK